MPTERRFAAFSRKAIPPRMSEIPEGGMCISSFVVLSKRGEPGRVLMGRVNKNAEWDRIGALDRKRAERVSTGWMLPSSHLMLYETPEGAARRVLREQLGMRGQSLEGPLIFSDTYGPENHWDIGFVYTGECDAVPKTRAWSELDFAKVEDVKDEIVRSQLDVLVYANKWAVRQSRSRL